MASEIELVSDDEGVVVTGDRSAIERFLNRAGLLSRAEEFGLGKLSAILQSGSDIAEAAARVAERSALYLKLTPDSAKRLRDAGGLMKTKTEGISHALLGEPGKVNGWLQVEDGPTSLLTNPALLSGIGGLMSQFAQQAEARELRALLVRIDEHLDDVRRAQRDAVLAKMDRAAAAIEEAITIRNHGGDPATLWAKVSGESATLFEVEHTALLELGALAEKVDGKTKTGALRSAAQEIERRAGVQLSILARCFELQDEFRLVELDHVYATAPQHLEGHRLGVANARKKRRAAVLERTGRLIEQITSAGGIANANILLHARAARSIIDLLNSATDIVDDFHAPLGIEARRDPLSAIPWAEAVHDPQQLKRAGLEVGQKAAVAGGTAAAVALAAIGRKKFPSGGS